MARRDLSAEVIQLDDLRQEREQLLAEMAADDRREMAKLESSQRHSPEGIRLLAEQEFDWKKDRAGNKTNVPLPTSHNARIALAKFGVRLRYDRFSDLALIEGTDSKHDGVLQDAAVRWLWFEIERKYGFQLGIEKWTSLLQDEAHRNDFHPVLDYLDGLHWDRVPRLDTWLIKYGGATDSLYSRAVGALPLIAAVRRVRKPGCMYQEILTLISETQGTGKSKALQALCANEDWFTDDLPLNAESQQVIERLQGHWIVECAETKGMKQGGNEHVKAFLSRRVDKARMAYGRLVKRAPRQCVFIATSNDATLLSDPTGNRRWWPVHIKEIDSAALRRDRDQIWAEAALREASGECIQLPQSLWSAAAVEQDKATAVNPWVELLEDKLDDRRGKISTEHVAWLLGFQDATRLGAVEGKRMADAMRKIGWQKHSVPLAHPDGGRKYCYTRPGTEAWLVAVRTVTAGVHTVIVEESDRAPAF